MKNTKGMPFSRLGRFYGLFKKRNVILPMFKDIFAGTYRISPMTALLFVLSFAYIISPIDIIPDWILGLGWIDDLIIFNYVSKFLNQELDKYKDHSNFSKGKPIVLPTKWK